MGTPRPSSSWSSQSGGERDGTQARQEAASSRRKHRVPWETKNGAPKIVLGDGEASVSLKGTGRGEAGTEGTVGR